MSPAADPNVRALAGLVLKNDVLGPNYARTRLPQLQRQILDHVASGLLDQNVLVRNITGSVVTALFLVYGPQEWPEIVPTLLDMASGANGASPVLQEGAASALAKICEDCAPALDTPRDGPAVLESLLVRLIGLLGHSLDAVVARALGCINLFIALHLQALTPKLGSVLDLLFALTEHASPAVRKNVCTAFYLLLDKYPQALAPHVPGVTRFCLHTIVAADDEDVALEACEFLLGLATLLDAALLSGLLPEMVPVLLLKMVYSKADIELFEAAEDDAHVEDRDEDIRPQNARVREKNARRDANAASNDHGSNGDSASNAAATGTSDDESASDDDDDDDDVPVSSWNLRKCLAATLDVCAKCAPEDVIRLTFPLLHDAPLWPEREAAILAFGAVLEACLETAPEKLPELVPYLATQLADPQPKVRGIACWALGRYAPWVCDQAAQNGPYAGYFAALLEAAMRCALDHTKAVQQAGMQTVDCLLAGADYASAAGVVEPLLAHFEACFARYQRKNTVILYDALQTFVEKVGDVLVSREDYVARLLPPLLSRWDLLSDEDPSLWPLLECMALVAASLGRRFAPYAPAAYTRALRILQSLAEPDFVITAVDLIDGLVQGLGPAFAELASTDPADVMLVVLACLDNPVHDIRQLAFALLGDMAMSVMPMVGGHVPGVVERIVREIHARAPETAAVVNNAAWTLGEMAVALPAEALAPFLDAVADALVDLVNDASVEQTVAENAAIALGRLGLHLAAAIAPRLPQFALSWCRYMRDLESNEEKDLAFRGMCLMVRTNPGGMSNALSEFELAVREYEYPGEELRGMFSELYSV